MCIGSVVNDLNLHFFNSFRSSGRSKMFFDRKLHFYQYSFYGAFVICRTYIQVQSFDETQNWAHGASFPIQAIKPAYEMCYLNKILPIIWVMANQCKHNITISDNSVYNSKKHLMDSFDCNYFNIQAHYPMYTDCNCFMSVRQFKTANKKRALPKCIFLSDC